MRVGGDALSAIFGHPGPWARSVRRCDVEIVGRGILKAAERQSVHVLAQAVLTDHVHGVISFRPDRAIMYLATQFARHPDRLPRE